VDGGRCRHSVPTRTRRVKRSTRSTRPAWRQRTRRIEQAPTICCGLSSKMERGSSELGRSLFSRTSRRDFRTDAASSSQRLPQGGLRSRSRTHSTQGGSPHNRERPGSRRYQPPNRRDATRSTPVTSHGSVPARQIIPAAADFDQCSLCMIRRSEGDDVDE
jgi:hypothetical protein